MCKTWMCIPYSRVPNAKLIWLCPWSCSFAVQVNCYISSLLLLNGEGYVLSFLLVCLLATSRKNIWANFHEIVRVTKKNLEYNQDVPDHQMDKEFFPFNRREFVSASNIKEKYRATVSSLASLFHASWISHSGGLLSRSASCFFIIIYIFRWISVC